MRALPRLGGPRFVKEPGRAREEQIVKDPRSNDQLALDVLIDLVRIGIDIDNETGDLLGSQKPAVRVTISLDDLLNAERREAMGEPAREADAGIAWLEGLGRTCFSRNGATLPLRLWRPPNRLGWSEPAS